jgi:hypothetical protein
VLGAEFAPPPDWWVAYLLAAAIGAAWGFAELAVRYQDSPMRAAWSRPGAGYIALNAGASALALLVVRNFEWGLGVEDPRKRAWAQIAVAGLGAAVVLRSSIFIVRADHTNVTIGPSTVLEALLGVADRGVDRRRASQRNRSVETACNGYSFEASHVAVTAYCFNLMQNVHPRVQEAFADKNIKPLVANEDMDDETKMKMLGLALMNVVGEEVLVVAVRSVGVPIGSAADD